jgi:hypothetical protein
MKRIAIVVLATVALASSGVPALAATSPAPSSISGLNGPLPANFAVPAGSTVTITNSHVTASAPIDVRGNLTISDSTITAPEGITVGGGSLTLKNVILKAPVHASGMGDMITLNSGSFSGDHVSITGDHCAFHFNGGPSGVTNFVLNQATVKSSVYAFMIGGGAPKGTKQITGLTIIDTPHGIQASNVKARYSFSGVTYQNVKSHTEITNPAQVTVS